MNKFFQRSLMVGCLLFALNFAQAEPIITEYHFLDMAIWIDLTDKKIQKSVYGRGILDITWDKKNATLAITYDPKVSDVRDIWRSLQEVINLNSSNPTGYSAKYQNK